MEAGDVIAHGRPGFGTPMPHSYLVGEPEAVGPLDSVHGARNLDGADASADFVVWGESQSCQAALFIRQLASSYGPELNVFWALPQVLRPPLS